MCYHSKDGTVPSISSIGSSVLFFGLKGKKYPIIIPEKCNYDSLGLVQDLHTEYTVVKSTAQEAKISIAHLQSSGNEKQHCLI